MHATDDTPLADAPRSCLYFWEDEDDPSTTGWWLAGAVGSNRYYAFSKGSLAKVPGPQHCATWKMGNPAAALMVLGVEAGEDGGSVVVRTANDDGRSLLGGLYVVDATPTLPKGSKARVVYRLVRACRVATLHHKPASAVYAPPTPHYTHTH